MTKAQSHPLSNNIVRRNPSIVYFITLIVLFLSAISLWLDNQELSQGRNIFYWSFGINLLFWTECLWLPLSITSLILWAKLNIRRTKKWHFIIALSVSLLLIFAYAFTNYVFMWAGSSIEHLETTEYKGNTYHLARILQFDERTKYYLGACKSMGFWCEFHEIFRTTSSDRPNNISLQATQGILLVKVEGELVYKYDETGEFCTTTERIYCHVDDQ